MAKMATDHCSDASDVTSVTADACQYNARDLAKIADANGDSCFLFLVSRNAIAINVIAKKERAPRLVQVRATTSKS